MDFELIGRKRSLNLASMGVFYIIAISQAIFLAVFLLVKRRKTLANIVLSLFLIAITISLFVKYAYEVELIYDYRFLLGLDSGIPFLYGPFMWTYAALLTGKKTRILWSDAWHLIPFLLQYVFMGFYLFPMDAGQKVDFYDTMLSGDMPSIFLLANVLKAIHAALYFYFTFRLVRASQGNLKHYFSSWQKASYEWLLILVKLMIPFAILKILVALSFYSDFLVRPGVVSFILDLSLFILIYVVGYYALSRPSLFELSRVELSSKYINPIIDAAESSVLFNRLTEFMETEKPYLQSDLSLNELAERMELKTKVLSQIINENSGSNFFHFINSFRVEHFKAELAKEDNQQYTLMAIAEKSGFASKTTFNQMFKKFQGITPREYVKQTSSTE